jgi:5-methylcytosine-specific restriction endonuclease McrA
MMLFNVHFPPKQFLERFFRNGKTIVNINLCDTINMRRELAGFYLPAKGRFVLTRDSLRKNPAKHKTAFCYEDNMFRHSAHEKREYYSCEGGVYGEKDDRYDPLYWLRIKLIVFERDNFRCKSCYKKLPKFRLTAHHIIPRSEGGNDDLDNLITLCHSCHDLIESILDENNLPRTKVAIIGFCAHPLETKAAADEERVLEHEEMLRKIDDERPDWHASVYGGRKGRK